MFRSDARRSDDSCICYRCNNVDYRNRWGGDDSLIAAIPMSVVLIGISTGVGTETSGTTPTISVGTTALCGLPSDTPAESETPALGLPTTPLALPVCAAQASPAPIPRSPNESRAASFLSQFAHVPRRNQAPFRLCADTASRSGLFASDMRYLCTLPHANGSQNQANTASRTSAYLEHPHRGARGMGILLSSVAHLRCARK